MERYSDVDKCIDCEVVNAEIPVLKKRVTDLTEGFADLVGCIEQECFMCGDLTSVRTIALKAREIAQRLAPIAPR